MEALADIAVHYLCLIEFSDDADIDLAVAAKEQEAWPLFFAALSAEEKAAMSAAARRTLEVMMPPVDEYGYDPGQLVTDEQREFIKALISGEAFQDYAD